MTRKIYIHDFDLADDSVLSSPVIDDYEDEHWHGAPACYDWPIEVPAMADMAYRHI